MNETESPHKTLSLPPDDDARTALITRRRTCPDCLGSGTVREYFQDAFGSFAWGPCGRCHGRGRL